jgi:hypothetical protein
MDVVQDQGQILLAGGQDLADARQALLGDVSHGPVM